MQANEIYEAMFSDKKKSAGRLRFVLPRDIGDVFLTDQVTEAQVLSTLCYCGAV
jgi:3-dehydroquinate synthetase